MATEPPISGVGAISAVRATTPSRIRVAGRLCHVTAPVMTPATREPRAHRASSTPAMAVSPSDSAKATVTTSVEPNSPPIAKLISATGTRSRHGIAT